MRPAPAAASLHWVSARLEEIARQSVAIVESGRYRTAAGEVVIGDMVRAAVEGTRLHLPEEPLEIRGDQADPVIEVTLESTLAAARRLGPQGASLNFASAKNPGGGFLRGAVAQEESLARSSALYHCLREVPEFYGYHRSNRDLRYSDRVIYSPRVPVFRDDHGDLLDEPYLTSFITAAAPNLGAITANQPEHADSVPGVLAGRARRVLTVAAAHGHRDLVLGAWGCGVFRNDPALVARAFRDALRSVPRFDRVVFAIVDHQPGTPTYLAFADLFAPGGPASKMSP